jgi:hypothetical protein
MFTKVAFYSSKFRNFDFEKLYKIIENYLAEILSNLHSSTIFTFKCQILDQSVHSEILQQKIQSWFDPHLALFDVYF